MRAWLILLVFASTARAEVTLEDLEAQNTASLAKAIKARHLVPVAMTEVSRKQLEPGNVITGPLRTTTSIELEIPQGAPLEFVADKQKRVFHVVRAPREKRRVKVLVCIAGPIRDYRDRVKLTVPDGYRYAGDVKVAYDAKKIVQENTCK
jgi:hypothetical protein